MQEIITLKDKINAEFPDLCQALDDAIAQSQKFAEHDRSWLHRTDGIFYQFYIPFINGFTNPLNKIKRLFRSIYKYKQKGIRQEAELFSQALKLIRMWINNLIIYNSQDDVDEDGDTIKSRPYLELIEGFYSKLVAMMPEDMEIQLQLFQPEIGEVPKKPRLWSKPKEKPNHVQFQIPFHKAQKLLSICYRKLRKIASKLGFPQRINGWDLRKPELVSSLVWIVENRDLEALA